MTFTAKDGALMTVPPELAALVRQIAETVAMPRIPSSAPAPGQSVQEWQADVAACRMAFDALVAAPGGPAPQDELTTSEVAIGACTGRLYRPAAPKPAPAVVIYHGGAFWMAGGTAMRRLLDPLCRRLATDLGAVVLTVDYRLGPEHKYPVPVDDSFAALRWMVTESGRLGVDPSRVGLLGISSGGNLAAATALRAVSCPPRPRVMVLMMPAVDLSGPAALADVEFHDGLDATAADLLVPMYVPPQIDRRDPGVSPGLAPDLTGMPPTFVVAAQYDVLRDMGLRFAARLSEAGIPAASAVYPMTHSVALPDTAEAYTADILGVLRQALARDEPDAWRWFPGQVYDASSDGEP